jgi:hypothetical protein
MIYLDATAIDTFLTCRESYRQRYLKNRVPAEPSVHLAFGHAVHTAVEYWHKGEKYEQCLYRAAVEMEKSGNEFEGRLRPDIEIKWRELGLALPECVAAYCDGVAADGDAVVEYEWEKQYKGVTLCGKVDRFSSNVMYDVKTASEVGRTWKSDYRSTLLRTFQFGLYDWMFKPAAIKIECIVKPYRGKPARLEIFDLPEILVYRKRFDQQLAWVVSEIVSYHEKYENVKPWPMASSQICQGKFQACPYLPICNQGESPRILERYKQREEHLQIRMNAHNEQSIQTK